MWRRHLTAFRFCMLWATILLLGLAVLMHFEWRLATTVTLGLRLALPFEHKAMFWISHVAFLDVYKSVSLGSVVLANILFEGTNLAYGFMVCRRHADIPRATYLRPEGSVSQLAGSRYISTFSLVNWLLGFSKLAPDL